MVAYYSMGSRWEKLCDIVLCVPRSDKSRKSFLRSVKLCRSVKFSYHEKLKYYYHGLDWQLENYSLYLIILP